jgi:hypothetical protein
MLLEKSQQTPPAPNDRSQSDSGPVLRLRQEPMPKTNLGWHRRVFVPPQPPPTVLLRRLS